MLRWVGVVAGTLILATSLSGSGCKNESGPAPAGPPAQAGSGRAIWDLAPSGLQVGLVVADGVGPSLHRALVIVHRALERYAATRPLAQELRARLTYRGIDLLDGEKLALAGIDIRRGAGFFLTDGGPVVVLPVSDRSRLVAAMGGKQEAGLDRLDDDMVCRELFGRYVCAKQAAQLAALARSTPASPVAGWPEEMRGDIELHVSPAALAGTPLTDVVTGSQGIRASVGIEPGGATLRAHVTGQPAGPVAVSRIAKPSRLLAGLADRPLNGLFVLHASALWQAFSPMVLSGAPPQKLPGGSTLAELLASLDGDIVAYTLSGLPRFGTIQIGLAKDAPWVQLVGACEEIARHLPAGITARKKGPTCSFSASPAAVGAGFVTASLGPLLSADLGVRPGALVVELGDATPTARPDGQLPAFPRQFLERGHVVAAWGHGSPFEAAKAMDPAAIGTLPSEPEAAALLFWLFHLNELGISLRVEDDGVHFALRTRTLWSNPDELVAELEKALDDLAAGQPQALARASALRARYPDSPLAGDEEAGYHGLFVPAAAVGLLAGFMYPSFEKYIEKARRD